MTPNVVYAALLFFILISSSTEKTKAQILGDKQPPTWGNFDASYCGSVGGTTCKNLVTTASQPDQSALRRSLSQAVLYVQVKSTSPTVNTGSPFSIVNWAPYFPYVDEYSYLQLPSTISSQLNDADLQMQVLMLFKGQTFRSGFVKIVQTSTTVDGGAHYVPARTLLITLAGGIPVKGGVRWAPTTCTLNACVCIDNICGTSTQSVLAANLNVSVRVSWTGTDAVGATLRSCNLDVWKFQNALST
jgi:hypothetical protein